MNTIEQKITNCLFYALIVLIMVINLLQANAITKMSEEIKALQDFKQEVWGTINDDQDQSQTDRIIKLIKLTENKH
jgi:outer membrane lipoprotein-sorting protein